jgi:hypothetical protein
MRRATLALLLLSLSMMLPAAACSGGGGEGSGAPREAARQPASAPPAGSSEPAAGSSEAKLRAAQASAVEAMCERLVQCAVESARANMTPDEVAELNLDETAPRLREQCQEDGDKSQLSPRQVRVVQRCVNEAAECEALQTCLEQARKQGS